MSALADQGAQHMISVEKAKIFQSLKTKVRCQGPLGVDRAQPCPGIKQNLLKLSSKLNSERKGRKRNAKHTTSLPFNYASKASSKEKKKGSRFCEQERGIDRYICNPKLPKYVSLPHAHFLICMVVSMHTGGGSQKKGAGMFVISLRGVNFRFWSHLSFSGKNTIIFSHKGRFQGCTRRNKKWMYRKIPKI